MFEKISIRLFALAAIVMTISPLQAQQPNLNSINRQRERQETTRFNSGVATTASAIEEKEAEEDLGRLVPDSGPKYFTASTNTRIEWDSNALLLSANPQDSMITTETLTLNYKYEFAPQWTLSSSVIQNFFWYEDSTANDFMGQIFTSDVGYQFQNGLRLNIGPTLFRYENINQGNQLIQAANIHLGASHSIGFFNGKSSLFYGYRLDAECTDPSAFDRQQHQLYVGWNQTILPSLLIMQGFYRFAYADYLTVSRYDKNNLAGLSFIFRINEYVSVNAFFNYNRNYSTVSSASYHNLASGASLNVSYPF